MYIPIGSVVLLNSCKDVPFTVIDIKEGNYTILGHVSPTVGFQLFEKVPKEALTLFK